MFVVRSTHLTGSQEHSLGARLILLYANTVATRNEITEVRRSIGTASYQIGEELEVCSFLSSLLLRYMLFYRATSKSIPGSFS